MVYSSLSPMYGISSIGIDAKPRTRGHPEAQAGSAAPRGLDARHRLVGPRPPGRSLFVPLLLCV
eukprot:scaffold95370_cov61-Phaeocystis_antarctica.AAC.3